MTSGNDDGTVVFDIGVHRGDDTAYYLERGHRVVAVDADHRLIEEVSARFPDEFGNGRLSLVNAAVADSPNGTVDFYLSGNSLWSSLETDISTRDGADSERISVRAISLADLVLEHGTPAYCKIDIEGADLAAVRSLTGIDALPPYISVETESLAQGHTADDDEALATLGALRDLGYSDFKLVDQRSLAPLRPGRRFYTRVYRSIWSPKGRLASSLGRVRLLRRAVNRRSGYPFPLGASGPFGAGLGGDWLDGETAVDTLLFHRRDYFASCIASPFGFWCDWHAKLEAG